MDFYLGLIQIIGVHPSEGSQVPGIRKWPKAYQPRIFDERRVDRIIEVDIAARNLEKSSAEVDRLESDARAGEQGPRANALWDLGLLGNRGVDRERIAQILLDSVHDSNENIRYWAVEGLAYLGTDEIIEPLLAVFHDDPSPKIRERAACGLAQSGMLNRSQRLTAVPRLLDYADDSSLDAQTRGWVFQALRDITGQTLPPDANAWRRWFRAER